MAEFSCDLNSQAVELNHFWERCVGSGHSTLALRADYQAQLKRCARELGFQRVRFHGWLLDQMGMVIPDANGVRYSFLNADKIVDFFASVGISPFVELSFMPKALALGGKTVFSYRGNVTPPKDYRAWQTAVRELVKHWLQTYGVRQMRDWFFEVWNEPNWPPFWTGTQADYFKFYRYTAEAVKGIEPRLQVGGPASAQNGWVPEFVSFCERTKTPFDFVSTHHYPNDPPLDKISDTTTGQLAAARRGQLCDAIRDVKRARNKPLFYTEWNSSSDDRDPRHDEPYAAAFIVKTILEANGLVDLYSYWVFTDIFAEQSFESRPFHGGFGLMTVHGVPKPAYRAFQLLRDLGTELLVSDGMHPTLNVWFVRKRKALTVILTNHAMPEHFIQTESVKIKLKNSRRPTKVTVQRIDENHANPCREWEEMGSPEYLDVKKIDRLEAASELKSEPIPFTYTGRTVELKIKMPVLSVAAIILEFGESESN